MQPFPAIGFPISVPERPADLARLASACLAALDPWIRSAMETFLAAPSPEGLLHFEEEAMRVFQTAASHVVAGVVAYVHLDIERLDRCVATVRAAQDVRLRHRGYRMAPVQFLGGARLLIATPYLSARGEGRRVRGEVGRRGAAGSGCYPVLESLGIVHQATPAVLCEVARQAARTASFSEAHEALCERGLPLDEKSVRTMALWVGERAVAQRAPRKAVAATGRTESREFAGRRIVLSADGGRLRLREGGQRGRRGKKGRRRYRTPWREPKLVVAYVIDADGSRAKDVPVLYDATLGDADAAFDLLVTELRLRGARDAKEITLTGDGAHWIWDRADDLARALGLRPDQIVKVADFYHAVEHLSHLAELCMRWSDADRSKWVRRMRRRLKRGKVDEVVKDARALARGRNGGKIMTEARYFENRRDLMRYDEFRRRGIPLGSGAVESAVRRVVNLRMKGPSIFWRGPNAERMLHLRCYLKAGRWTELIRRVINQTPILADGHEAMRGAA